MPKRRRTCPSCKKVTFADAKQRFFASKLLTKQQRDVIRWCAMMGVEPEAFARRGDELKTDFGCTPALHDVVWSIAHDTVPPFFPVLDEVMKAEGHEDWAHRELLSDQWFRLVVQETARQYLCRVKQNELVDLERTRVVVITTKHTSCAVCRRLEGLTFSVDEALDRMPIPVRDCTHAQGCRCCYGLAFADQDGRFPFEAFQEDTLKDNHGRETTTEDKIDKGSQDTAKARAAEFWHGMAENWDAGQYWAERIKHYPHDACRQLASALSNILWPGNFRGASTVVRALIRAKRKRKEDFEEELSLLYWLAAIASFGLPYAPRLREPGLNVLLTIPPTQVRSLRYTYDSLGYRHLSLLNKTDIKWLTAAWGEPTSHSTLNTMHRALWDEYETRLVRDRKRADRELHAEIDRLLSGG